MGQELVPSAAQTNNIVQPLQPTRRKPNFILSLATLLAAVAGLSAASPVLTYLHHFGPRLSDGFWPNPLVAATDGAIYGTTTRGGAATQGTLYRLNTNNSTRTVLFEFSPNSTNGIQPGGPLIHGSDGDGVLDTDEQLASTDPHNPASVFRIVAIQPEPSGVRIIWSTVGGKSYVVQTNGNPGGPFADSSPLITMPGTGEFTTNRVDSSAANAPARYYRVRLGP